MGEEWWRTILRQVSVDWSWVIIPNRIENLGRKFTNVGTSFRKRSAKILNKTELSTEEIWIYITSSARTKLHQKYLASRITWVGHILQLEVW